MNTSDLDRDALIADIAEAVAVKLAAQPKLVDRYALAKIVGVSVPSIERAQRCGLIPVVRLGRRCLYDPAAVVAALSTSGKVRAK